MTDTAKIIADARKISDLVVSQSEALTAYVTAAHAAADAVLALAGEIEAEAGGDDDGLPKASLHDAADTLPGGTMVFPLTLDKPSAVEVKITVNIAGIVKQITLVAGETSLDISVPIQADATPGTLHASITAIDGLEIADGEAIGKIVAALPPNGLPASGSDVTEPIVFPAGAWREMRTFAAKVKLDSAPSPAAHVKVAGGDSSANDSGGWVLERHSGGQMQAWVYVGGVAQKAMSTGQLPLGTAVFVAVRFYLDHIALTMGDQTFTKLWFKAAHAEFDGPSVVGDGYWKHQLAGAWPGEILEWTALPTALSDAELAALADEWFEGELPPPNGGNGNGGNGNGGNGNGNGNGGNGGGGGNPARPIEPGNSSLHQVTLAIASDAPMHVWEGPGTGLNTFEGARAVFDRVKQHRAKYDAIGMHVLRIFTPNSKADCVAAYKPYFELFRPRLVVASGFIYRSKGNVRNNIRALAEGVKYCWDHGLPIHIVTNQNEPDGNPGNKPRFDKPGETISDHHKWMREDLDSLGLQHVKVAMLEWRHPPNGGIPEFDQLKAAGLIGKGRAVTIGCGHVYDKTQGLDLGDRLRSVGCTWSSWETGNNGSGCSSVARALSAANLGSAFDCMHYSMIVARDPDPKKRAEQLGQAFLDYDCTERPWRGHWEVAFGKALVPESTIYRCSSSDRAPGMPTAMDQWMVRNAAVSSGRNPRLNVVVGRRKDGKTAIADTNTTHGSDGFSPYTGGHYGNLNQQHTLRVPWLAGKNGSFQVWRASPEGAVSGPQVVGMEDGWVRWSVSGAQTVGLVGGAA